MAAGPLLKRQRQKTAINGVKKVKHLVIRGQEEGDISLQEEEVILKQIVI